MNWKNVNILKKNADIYFETRKICSREGLKAYGYEDYFKVPSVVILSTVSDAASKPRDSEKKQQKSKSSFEEVLQAETERQSDAKREISYDVKGYSKDAKAIQYEVMMHEYN